MAASVQTTSRASGVTPNNSKDQASSSIGNGYCYSPLPRGSIRLLRLMPHKDKEAPIRCQLFEYPLQEPGQRMHLYEALSYVWGSAENKQPIYVQSNERSGDSSATPSTGNGHYLLVTANLYEALSYLRDRVLERVIWIDAVCINQNNNDEKGHQVQSMAKIYANASRVIVWLGKAAGGSDQAFEALCRAARGRHAPPAIDEPAQQAILTLLERPWFRRVWVLQEVAAARYVLIKCGSSAVDGYIFCLGLGESNLSYDSHPALRDLIPPITYLIRDAVVRPQYERSLPETSLLSRFSLNIRPLGELVDMFHTREATNPLDKVYALLGMSSDNPGDPKAAGLYEADYTASWAEVFRKLAQFSLSDQMSVDTWNERFMAVVRGKGHILGKVSLVDPRGDAQSIGIVWKNSLGYFDPQGERSSQFLLQPSAKLIRPGDAVCLLQGASQPTIVRPRDCYSEIIVIAAPLTDDESSDGLRSITTSPIDLVLIWDWDASQRKPQDRGYEPFTDEWGGPWDKAARSWDFGVLLNVMERYKDAGENLRKAVEGYRAALKSTSDHPGHDGETLKTIRDLAIGAAGDAKSFFNDQTPLLWAAKNGHKSVVKLLLDKCLAIETKDSEYLRTPLSWAAGNGDEALVKLLLDKGAAIETKDNSSQTPLHLAAQKGHEAVTRLLAELGADKEAKDNRGWTPLHLAVGYGHKTVARVLGADKYAEDDEEWTPLRLAVRIGREAVVRLLAELDADKEGNGHATVVQVLAELHADKMANNNEAWTPLHLAAENGYETVARLLTESGADTEARDSFGRTPLYRAVENGHDAIARLLTELGADTETKDGPGRTPLHWAVENGNEAMAGLLIELGADIKTRDSFGRTPLYRAVENRHDAIARLLTELGADIGTEDGFGQTPLHRAAQIGHEAAVRLLTGLGADTEARNDYGQTPLHCAAQRGREAVARLLVELGADKEARDDWGKTPWHWATEKGHEAIARLCK